MPRNETDEREAIEWQINGCISKEDNSLVTEQEANDFWDALLDVCEAKGLQVGGGMIPWNEFHHTYSVEHLAHYHCGKCKKWWSIGDGPTWEMNRVPQVLYCPWCGCLGALQKKEEKKG